MPVPPWQNQRKQLFQQATLIVKVKEPLLSECQFFRPGQTLFTYLHLASSAGSDEGPPGCHDHRDCL